MRDRLRREARLLGAAFVLLTRLPMPAIAFAPDWLPRSARYMPLVGALVGAAGAAILAAASLVWPQPIPAGAALAGTLLLTGALHEDGLADTADAFGGTTRERRLAIMKDSRLGTFGALALLVCLAGEVAALATLPVALGASSLVAAGAGARAAAVCLMRAARYAAPPEAAKVAAAPDRPTGGEVALALAFAVAAVLPLAAQSTGRTLAALLLGAGLAGLGAWRSCRALGGYTGDVLGATAILFQLGFLLGAAARWPAAGP